MNRLIVVSLLAAWPALGCGSSGGSGAPSPVEDVGEDVSTDCLCEPEEHCGPDGSCQPDVCVQGGVTCATTSQIQYCDDTGADFTVVDCDAGYQCEVGSCAAIICEPGVTDCEAGYKVTCNSLGTQWVPVPCPETDVCVGGECVFVQPNILLLVDTSYSMNWVLGTHEVPKACDPEAEPEGEADCLPWTYPRCDDPENPGTRLGVVKKILQDLVVKSAEADLRLALQRFPQTHASNGGCLQGHYESIPKMSGDNGAHNTEGEDWFQIYRGETVVVPFDDEGGSDSETIARWCDFEESIYSTGGDCVTHDECPDGFCQFSGCMTHEEPELRGVGDTPLGKSLFYAGEYLRHAVFVEGATCVETADCGSPHHQCVDGACHDPLGKCRSTRIVVFTDGVESANHDLDDFYHPRVQAKRLHYGLGCEALDECVGGATCEGGICRAPEGTVAAGELACTIYEEDCASDADCRDFACDDLTDALCPGDCREAAVTLVDGAGGDRLTDASGRPVSVTVHVVDASGIEGANRFIAAYGGGEHVSVDLGAASTIVASVLPLLDAKVSPDGKVCDLNGE